MDRWIHGVGVWILHMALARLPRRADFLSIKTDVHAGSARRGGLIVRFDWSSLCGLLSRDAMQSCLAGSNTIVPFRAGVHRNRDTSFVGWY